MSRQERIWAEMATRPLTERQIQILARGLEKRVALRLAAAIRKIQAGVRLSVLERAVVAENFVAVSDALGLKQVTVALKDAQVATAVVRDQAWFSVLAKLPPSLVTRQLVAVTVGKYARQSPHVMAAIKRQDLTRIQGIRSESATAIRQTLTRSLAQGKPPAETARLLRSVLGLNSRQAKAVRTLREEMQARGVDQATVEKRVARYAQRQLNQRAETIAINETMIALSAGQRLQQDRLVREGVINVDQWEQENVGADDDRTCPICAPLHGVRFPIGGTIETINGPFFGPPYHVRCRDIVRVVLKGFRAGQQPSPVRRAILRRVAA